jgi:hypothetical protein
MIMQMKSFQSRLAAEERSFVSSCQALRTELTRAEHDAAARASQARAQYAARVQDLQARHEKELRSLPPVLEPRQDPPEVVQERPAHVVPVEEIEDEDDDTTIFANRVSGLEQQRRTMVQAIRHEQDAANSRLDQLEDMRNDEEATFEAKVGQIQAKMAQHEEMCWQQRDQVSGELRAVQKRRRSAAVANDRKIEEWHTKIETSNEELRQKVRDATLVTERLRAALASVNLRSSARLEAETKRGQDRRRLRKETLELQWDLFNRGKQVQIACDGSHLLRREFSRRIGPKRTASFYI